MSQYVVCELQYARCTRMFYIRSDFAACEPALLNIAAKYFFTEVKGEAVSLVCGAQVAVFKDYNLNRHYVTKHEETHKNLTDEERAREWDALLAKLQNQQGLFT